MNANSSQKRIAFGYNRDSDCSVILLEGQAACVQLTYAYYLEGKSIAEIKDILKGIRIPSPYNKSMWGKQTLANILSNPHYTGSEVYPTITSKEDFEKVQQIKKSQKES